MFPTAGLLRPLAVGGPDAGERGCPFPSPSPQSGGRAGRRHSHPYPLAVTAPFVLLEELPFPGGEVSPPAPAPTPAKRSVLRGQQARCSPPSPGPSYSSMELQTLVDAREVDEPPC